MARIAINVGGSPKERDPTQSPMTESASRSTRRPRNARLHAMPRPCGDSVRRLARAVKSPGAGEDAGEAVRRAIVQGHATAGRGGSITPEGRETGRRLGIIGASSVLKYAVGGTSVRRWDQPNLVAVGELSSPSLYCPKREGDETQILPGDR